MENERVYLVGCILKGMAQNKVYFGMAEDALAIADAVLLQMKDHPASQPSCAVHENQADYNLS